MILKPLTDRDEIAEAYGTYVERMMAGTEEYQRYLGHKSGGALRTIYWQPKLGMWAELPPYSSDWKLRCCYGLVNPVPSPRLGITCQINFPPKGMDRKLGGALLRDETGRIWVAHSGAIGGGQTGVGKTAFLRYHPACLQPVTWPDGATSDMILIAALDDADLPAKIAKFVRTVAEFKAAATGRGR